jgi:hypothetical protein
MEADSPALFVARWLAPGGVYLLGTLYVTENWFPRCLTQGERMKGQGLQKLRISPRKITEEDAEILSTP